MSKPTILVAYGTRPEAIKVAPVVQALAASSLLRGSTAVTGQHREMLDQVNGLFGIVPDHDLDILQPGQQLHEITHRALDGMVGVLRAERPDGVLVQGDTTTTFVAALAAHYEQIPVFHLEAGLRTGSPLQPVPGGDEPPADHPADRAAPRPHAASRDNLLREGFDPATVFVTGNTVIDALLDVVAREAPLENTAIANALRQRMVLVTSHRRESWGEPMARIADALVTLATAFPDVEFLLPAHPNPVVRDVLVPRLDPLPNVLIVDPLGYADFSRAMHACELVLTDSGGVQEEAPSLGKPVLVLRDTTERPEAVAAGTARLVGSDPDVIVDAVSTLLTDPVAYATMAHAVNPYGDGAASARVVAAIAHWFGLGDPPADFAPATS